MSNNKVQNIVHKALVGFIAGSVIAAIIAFGGANVYNTILDVKIRRQTHYWQTITGSEVLNVKSVTAPESVPVGSDFEVGFCREPLARITAVNNVRTYYLTKDGKERPVGQRRLADGIEYEATTSCTDLPIKASNLPNVAGVYRFCQTFDFSTHGFDKTANFCSTKFSVFNITKE